MRLPKKPALFIGTALLLCGLGVAGSVLLRKSTPVQTNTATQIPVTQDVTSPEPSTNTVTMVAVGDMLAHDSINKNAKTATGYDYTPFFSETKQFYTNADIRFCNLETPTAGNVYPITDYPAFNAPAQYSIDLQTVGCNLISFANNHTNDKGQGGINETLKVWDGLEKLAIAGANRSPQEQQQIRYFTVKGIKFAFIAYAEYLNIKGANSYGVDVYNAAASTATVKQAKQNADIVVVSMHWGTEYSDSENAFQKTAAQNLANAGADIVIGTGPHVLQPATILSGSTGNKTVVWYSLGNMLNTQLDTPSLIGGFAAMTVKKVADKPVVTIRGLLPTYMHYEWTAADKASQNLLARKNLKIYPLDKASEPLARSQANTTVEAQTQRIQNLLNRYTQVKILTSNEL
jgi:poly-gamma-glutamate capsule biosynthesis protein CapA/YwtB (metallophosphatase superfamily)